jgi:type IV pilus assembly protein PilV
MLNMKKPLSRFAALRKRIQSGMTLIEVMVAVLIFSLGLLGLVGLQSRAVQLSTVAEDSNRAALLANEIASEILFKNKPRGAAATTAVDLTGVGVSAWQGRVSDLTKNGLPNGSGVVTSVGNVATITITWKATNAKATGPSSLSNRYVTQVFLP